jgi:aminoglycoside phosphotransferase (APT) family kinase protein
VIDELALVLRPILGDDVVVEDLQTLTGGASRTTYSFDAVTAAERRRLILRSAPVDNRFAGMELEAAVQQAAAEAGAPVPHIIAASDSAAALGNQFLICDEVAGETIVRRIQRSLDGNGRAALLEQCAQALAAIHRARTDAAGLAEKDQLTEWRQRLDELGDTTATFEWAFRWLAANRPAHSAMRLVHGDFRMGNLIIDGLGRGPTLAAVLDWEAVHIGQVYEDLAWFCIRAWRFGAPTELAAGGLGTIEDFVTAYERAGGAAVDRSALHWWLVLGTLRWGIICRYQAERHLSGQTRSVELAAIGRRVCETEWDLLDLLEEAR